MARRKPGPPKNPDALSRKGWRGPMVHRRYKALFDALGKRPEFKGLNAPQLFIAILESVATPEEKAVLTPESEPA